MAVEINGKVYRNLQEQVLANQRDIEDIIKDESKMVANISLNDSTYTPSDGTITLPGLVTTGTEQTVSAKKSFTDTIEVKGAEINAETRIGTYPSSIEVTVILNVNRVAADLVAFEKVDFENHKISKGAWLYFVYPKKLRTNYGLHGQGGASSGPFSAYTLDKDVSIPETITTEEQLKAYVKSSAFASAVDSAGYTLDEYFIFNDVAVYASDIQSISFDGTTVVGDDILDCQQGEGEQIVGAADPIIAHILKTKNLKVENLEVENRTKELNAVNAKFTTLEITGKLTYSGSELKLKGVQPTLTRHYVQLQDVANNKLISATFIFRKSAKLTSMDDFFNTLVGEYGLSPSNLPFFGAGVIYILTFIGPTMISVNGFNMATASVVTNANIKFLNDTISAMGNK